MGEGLGRKYIGKLRQLSPGSHRDHANHPLALQLQTSGTPSSITYGHSLVFGCVHCKMPRATKRQRIVFCDCLDCADFADTPNTYGWEAAAKQLPPPKSLVVVLEGFNTAPEPASDDTAFCLVDQLFLPHMNNVARHGVTFCLAQTGALLQRPASTSRHHAKPHAAEPAHFDDAHVMRP